jgi:hypothetical protein
VRHFQLRVLLGRTPSRAARIHTPPQIRRTELHVCATLSESWSRPFGRRGVRAEGGKDVRVVLQRSPDPLSREHSWPSRRACVPCMAPIPLHAAVVVARVEAGAAWCAAGVVILPSPSRSHGCLSCLRPALSTDAFWDALPRFRLQCPDMKEESTVSRGTAFERLITLQKGSPGLGPSREREGALVSFSAG